MPHEGIKCRHDTAKSSNYLLIENPEKYWKNCENIAFLRKTSKEKAKCDYTFGNEKSS